MNVAPQKLLEEYVKIQIFGSTSDIMEAMKEMFRDVIQTSMEVELDEELGRERCQRAQASETTPNYRNGYSKKTVKTQLGTGGYQGSPGSERQLGAENHRQVQPER